MKHKYNNTHSTGIIRTPKEQAESIEQQIRRLTANKEIVPQNVPSIYTPREDGVDPAYDVRTDRWELAIKAGNKYTASQLAKSAGKGEGNEPDNAA